MNGTDVVTIPKFMENEPLPEGYYATPDPYLNPPKAKYNFRAMVNYAIRSGKRVTDLSREEVKPFLIQ